MDCLEALNLLEDNSVDSLVTDPPAGISFMGKAWDDDKGGRKQWIAWLTTVMQECMRVLKPGAHGLVWAIPRTSHWTATALEDAGFEIRDVVTHLFGSGFPKSLDVSKTIDKAAGARRELGPTIGELNGRNINNHKRNHDVLAQVNGWDKRVSSPATDEAKQWQGYGTALKPASEHWILVRKPISEKTVAANVIKWSVGAINIDASRVTTNDQLSIGSGKSKTYEQASSGNNPGEQNSLGRFPANLVLSCAPTCTENEHDKINCPIALMDEQSGVSKSVSGDPNKSYVRPQQNTYGKQYSDNKYKNSQHQDSGGASRFFYCAKASKADKNFGLEGMPKKNSAVGNASGRGFSETNPYAERLNENHHPTVKSTKLMAYLIKMVTPPSGVVLDPFMGSGTTGVSALKQQFEFIGIEKQKDYFEIAKARLKNA